MRVPEVPCYFLWLLLGKFLSSSQDSRVFPMGRVWGPLVPWHAEMPAELCCSACSMCPSGTYRSVLGTARCHFSTRLEVKKPWHTSPWDEEREKGSRAGTFWTTCSEPYLLLASSTALLLPAFPLKVKVSLHGEQLQLQRRSCWPGLGAFREERE